MKRSASVFLAVLCLSVCSCRVTSNPTVALPKEGEAQGLEYKAGYRKTVSLEFEASEFDLVEILSPTISLENTAVLTRGKKDQFLVEVDIVGNDLPEIEKYAEEQLSKQSGSRTIRIVEDEKCRLKSGWSTRQVLGSATCLGDIRVRLPINILWASGPSSVVRVLTRPGVVLTEFGCDKVSELRVGDTVFTTFPDFEFESLSEAFKSKITRVAKRENKTFYELDSNGELDNVRRSFCRYFSVGRFGPLKRNEKVMFRLNWDSTDSFLTIQDIAGLGVLNATSTRPWKYYSLYRFIKYVPFEERVGERPEWSF